MRALIEPWKKGHQRIMHQVIAQRTLTGKGRTDIPGKVMRNTPKSSSTIKKLSPGSQSK